MGRLEEQRAGGEAVEEGPPVHDPASGRAGELDERRGEVGVDDRIGHGAGGEARSDDEEGHPDRLLVDPRFPPLDAVLAVEEAVVGGEHDHGVLELAALPQRVVDALDHLVHREQRRGLVAVGPRDLVDLGRGQLRQVPDRSRLVAHVGLVERGRAWERGGRVPALVAGGGLDRDGRRAGGELPVRRDGRHREEERRAGRPPVDEVDRVVGDDVGLVVGRLRSEPLHRAVPVHEVAVGPVGPAVEQPVPLGPPGRDLLRVIGAVTVEVLPDVAGGVAGRPQPHRERVRVVQAPVPAVRRRPVAVHAVVVHVLAGEEGRPRRAAEREVHEAVRERGALDAPSRARVRGMKRISSAVWSSVITTTMFGRGVAASTTGSNGTSAATSTKPRTTACRRLPRSGTSRRYPALSRWTRTWLRSADDRIRPVRAGPGRAGRRGRQLGGVPLGHRAARRSRSGALPDHAAPHRRRGHGAPGVRRGLGPCRSRGRLRGGGDVPAAARSRARTGRTARQQRGAVVRQLVARAVRPRRHALVASAPAARARLRRRPARRDHRPRAAALPRRRPRTHQRVAVRHPHDRQLRVRHRLPALRDPLGRAGDGLRAAVDPGAERDPQPGPVAGAPPAPRARWSSASPGSG